MIEQFAIQETSFFFSTAIGATPINAINPINNVNGMIMRNLSMMEGTRMQLYADTAAPTGLNDTTKRLIGEVSGSWKTEFNLGPYFFDPAIGLWFVGTAAGRAAFSYRFL